MKPDKDVVIFFKAVGLVLYIAGGLVGCALALYATVWVIHFLWRIT